MSNRAPFSFSLFQGPLCAATRVAALLAVGCLTATTAFAQNTEINPVRIQVTSSATGAAVQDGYVLAYPIGQDPVAAISDPLGMTGFPQLGIPSATATEEIPVLIPVLTNRVGFLPSKRVVGYSDHERTLQIPLVPEDTGYKTELIRASKGGSFALEGLGTILVAPGSLTQDVTLRVIPIPMTAWSHGILAATDGALRHQVWLGAYDSGGNPAPGALPSSPGAIRLQTVIPWQQAIPVGATNEVWTTHALGETYQQHATGIAQMSPDNNTIDMPLAAGHNLLTWNHTVAFGATCTAGPWEFEWRYVSTRRASAGVTHVLCGKYIQDRSCEVSEGKTREASMSISSTIATEVGLEAGIGIEKITGKESFSVTGSISGTTSTTRTNTSEAKVTTGKGMDGNDTPGPGFKCIDAQVHIGEIYRKYAVWATRRVVCTDGTITRDSKKLGEVEVFQGMGQWFEGPQPGQTNPVWNTTCTGCNPAGTMPPIPNTW